MSDLRQRLSSLIDEYITDDILKAQIIEAFDAEKPIKVHIKCKACRREYWYNTKAPDIVARVKALSELINQAKGTPAQTIKQQVTVNAITTLEQLEQLSDTELAELAYAGGSPKALPEATSEASNRTAASK